ncbi:hypothetical protein CAPTEDRAFT_222183 [Capitella teleta]|uniref:Resistance to inhibitors of cholinesterase protein 3 N-terminal domain-containing protein n=1 Tax=Capitella teleta TaxID=283909 RepID=R7UQB8_CAPTE|nr:hypothetical protein CAPTEDRAFT_222183 [Capitella teleta]|eukprot:ELU05586.1 hypothetical protein CAPTEDRAFT_222183 [Capitella teleta]
MEMTSVKTLVVFSIIIGCFAVLYPKIFQPMLLHAFGSGENSFHKDPMDSGPGSLPPHLRNPGAKTSHKVQHGEEYISRTMKAGPHPGMRAAAEMKKQAAQTQGAGGKGMMAIVLPMYAVGIVIYLIYTLSKVFGKRDKKAEGRDYLSSHFSDIQYSAEKQKFSRRGIPDTDEEEEPEPINSRTRTKKKRRDLERLLMKADRDKISELEMSELKRRLLETEDQMTRILQAMETVTHEVDATVNEEAAEEHSDLPSPEKCEEVVDDDTVYVKSNASSPDTESYEFLNSKTPDSEDIKEMPTEETPVEDIGAEEGEESEEASDEEEEEGGDDEDDYESEVMEDDDVGDEFTTGGDFEVEKTPVEVRQRIPKKKMKSARID